MADFLLEIGTEEIPAGMIRGLFQDLARGVEERLRGAGLPFELLLPGGAPRRIGFIVQGLPERQEDRAETVFGPPLKQARDETGNWTQAALGFARKQGVDVSALREVQGPRGSCAGFDREVKGRSAEEILSEVIPAAVDGLFLPKSMRWGSGEHLFVRPVRWVAALLDDRVVPMVIKGMASGRTSRGHRIFGPAAVEVPSVKEYFKVLREARVVPDPEQRRRFIQEGLDSAAKARGGVWNVSPESEALLETVTYLCEYPSVLVGSIPEEFTALPASILGTCLREHQKSFTIYEKPSGGEEPRALPFFAAVIDAPGDPQDLIRRGNENVTVARLSDARFFYEHDKAVPLERRLDDLQGIVFHPKLGTYFNKVKRLEDIARDLALAWGLDPAKAARAALLCKSDLASLLVQEKEFTSLQGIAGGLYAEAQGEDPEVARAIRDHYKPVSQEGTLPENLLGCVVAICDKIDTLAKMFSIKQMPSGSKDPFALRRAGMGIIRILIERKLSARLEMLAKSMQDPRELLDFLKGRLQFYWQEKGYSYDEINAVLAPGSDSPDYNPGDYDPSEIHSRLEAVHAVREEFPADFDALSVAFKRSRNILKGIPEYALDPAHFLPQGMKEGDGERALFAAVETVKDEAGKLLDAGEYAAALRKLATVRPAVDTFFDDVLVMCDPEGKDSEKTALQQNRLALLQRLVGLFSRVADFSEIVPRGAN